MQRTTKAFPLRGRWVRRKAKTDEVSEKIQKTRRKGLTTRHIRGKLNLYTYRTEAWVASRSGAVVKINFGRVYLTQNKRGDN